MKRFEVFGGLVAGVLVSGMFYSAKADSYQYTNDSGQASVTLSSGSVQDGVTVLSEAADFTFVTNNNTIMITGYIGSGGDVTIPDTINCLPVTAIGYAAFNGEAGLTKAVIPPSVTSIDTYAFQNCTSLTNVTIGSGVVSIGSHAFYYCNALVDIAIPESVSSIGSQAFGSCGSLVSIDVAPNNAAYASLDGVLFSKNCDTLIMYPPGRSGDYTIPGSVVYVGNNSFQYCFNLTGIVVPDSVTSIGEAGFYGCTSLMNAVIGAAVESFGNTVFYYCTSLHGIYFFGDAPSLGTHVFDYDGYLTIYHTADTTGWPQVPDSWDGIPTALWYPEYQLTVNNGTGSGSYTNGAVVSITASNAPDGQVFDRWTGDTQYVASVMSSSTTVTMPGTDIEVSATYQTDNIADFTYTVSDNQITITGYTGSGGEVPVPHSIDGLPVTSIGNNAFYGSSTLTGITVPSGVTNISDSAFYYCSALSCADIPEGVLSIGSGVFRNCGLLTSITLPDSLVTLGNNAFDDCYSLTNVILGSGLTSIERQTFTSCSSLTHLVVPDSVTNIGDQAFSSCTALADIEIGSGVAGFGSSVFYECSALTAIDVDFSNVVFSSDDGVLCNKAQTLVIKCPQAMSGSYVMPETVADIGLEAFYACSGVTNITMSAALTNISTGAFSWCIELTDMTLPDSVTAVGSSAFYYCSALDSFAFNTNLLFIGNSAFSGCSELKDLVIPDSVTNIENNAFGSCSGLTNLVIGSGTDVISDGMFGNCSSLTSVTIPDNITSIGFTSFMNCSSLTNIAIPASVVSIDGSAFKNCTGLYSVSLPDSITTIGSSAFNGCAGLSAIVLPAGITNIASEIFRSCTGLSSVVIPSGVTSIGSYAFNGCASLTSLDLPSGLVTIQDNAFNWCSGLTSLILPDSVSTIGGSAFSLCTNLNSIVLSTNLTSIGSWAFSYCSSLTSIVMPASLSSIDVYAFQNCTGLEGLYFLGDAPVLGGESVFDNATNTVIYRLSTATGWPSEGELWGGCLTVLCYQLTVNSGMGGGFYTNGAVVSIAASNAPSGQVFDRWTGDTQYVASVASSATTVAMPAANVEVTATYRSTVETDFSDDFEADVLDPFWTTSLQNGTIALSSARAHGGTQSVCFSAPSGGQKYLHLRHIFDEPQYGTVTVWVYDSQEYIYFSVSLFNTTNEAYGVNIGVQDWDHSAYYYNACMTNWVGGISSVARSVGWRKFTFQCLENELILSVDGQELYRGAGVGPFKLARLTVSGPGTGAGTIYFDDFSFDGPWPDLDGDGLPDWWEEQYFGAVGINSSAICSNGINTISEAYIAGLDPTDPTARFEIGGYSANTLQWSGVSGRVYSVWWSTNLMNGFQCLESNLFWNTGAYTDTVNNASSEGFYQLKVQLEE